MRRESHHPFGNKAVYSAILAGCWLLLAGCVYMPRFENVEVSQAFKPNPDSRINRQLGKASGNQGQALLVEQPELALESRLALVEFADTSIDAQYFIWQNDPTGILMIEKLLAAADRGVRVRALVDDIQLNGLIGRLSALDDHPNIEIRIFNPFSLRVRPTPGLFRLAEFAIDGNRLNHRMHNKLLVADNQLAIVGGRNIGDDYFGKSSTRDFIDTDILLSGKAVGELSNGFDTYWNSRWAYPVDALIELPHLPVSLDTVRKRIDKRLQKFAEFHQYRRDGGHSFTIEQLLSAAPLDRSLVVIDDPAVAWFVS